MVPDSFKEKYALPVTAGIESFAFSLDGGGRSLVVEAIEEEKCCTMVEIGCFLCGSTTLWLRNCPRLEVVGIDPWEGDWHEKLRYYAKIVSKPWREIEDVEAVINSVMRNGAYLSAMANVQQYQGRFFPVKGTSPAKLYELRDEGVEPDIVYFDSNKRLDDLDVAYQLWPQAILSGDDWSWGEGKGYPVRRIVREFCERHGFRVRARGATWRIYKS